MEPAGQARLGAAGVTAREAEILAAIGRRLTNREIPARLSLSVRTVESHVSALLRKLGFSGRPELVKLAQQLTGEQLIPASTTSFVGRDGELAELSAMLAASTLVCLAGPAGCGKTRLALEAGAAGAASRAATHARKHAARRAVRRASWSSRPRRAWTSAP